MCHDYVLLCGSAGVDVPSTGCTGYMAAEFDVNVTVHRDKFLIIKPTRCANFSNLLLE